MAASTLRGLYLPFLLSALLLSSVHASAFAQTSHTRARNVILYYLDKGPINSANTRSLIAYIGPNGNARDWLFDGIILYDNAFGKCEPSAKGCPPTPRPTPQAPTEYRNVLFGAGQLSNLAEFVKELRTELGDPDYRLKVYLTVPYVPGNDVVAETQDLISRFTSLRRSELELAGFYWGYSEDIIIWERGVGRVPEPGVVHALAVLAPFIKNQGYELIWIPQFNAFSIPDWRQYGFDRVVIQPNYAFADDERPGLERFRQADDKMRQYGLAGTELEFYIPRNPIAMQLRNSEIESGRAYLQAADIHNWVENSLSVVYFGPDFATYYSNSLAYREIYDSFYRFVSARSRASRASRIRIVAGADTYTSVVPNTNHGSEPRLIVGSNTYPNFYRAYLRFNLPGSTNGEVISARLQLTLRSFDYGDDLNDLELLLLEQLGDQFSELALTASSQPPDALRPFKSINTHRVTKSGSPRHSFDVTDVVKKALELRKHSISFVLRRRSETPTAAEVSFHSREAPTGPVLKTGARIDAQWNPAIELTLLP